MSMRLEGATGAPPPCKGLVDAGPRMVHDGGMLDGETRLAAHHLRAWPMRAMRRLGGTVETSCEMACASCARRFSLGVLPYTSLHACQQDTPPVFQDHSTVINLLMTTSEAGFPCEALHPQCVLPYYVPLCMCSRTLKYCWDNITQRCRAARLKVNAMGPRPCQEGSTPQRMPTGHAPDVEVGAPAQVLQLHVAVRLELLHVREHGRLAQHRARCVHLPQLHHLQHHLYRQQPHALPRQGTRAIHRWTPRNPAPCSTARALHALQFLLMHWPRSACSTTCHAATVLGEP